MADSTQPNQIAKAVSELEVRKQRKREYDRKRYLANREAIAEYGRAYRQANAQKIRERERVRYAENLEACRQARRSSAKRNRDKNTAREREWRSRNKDRVRGYYRKHVNKRRKTDIAFHLQMTVRTRIHGALARSSLGKEACTLEYVGCTASELRCWLESKFLSGMTWENRGRHGWHIDHIIPLAKFDLSDPVQQAAAFHYTNLQPLWAKDNLRKSDKVAGQQCFGFAYAARIADAAAAKPKKRRKHGGQHSSHRPGYAQGPVGIVYPPAGDRGTLDRLGSPTHSAAGGLGVPAEE
jgi:hypothetical protein